MNKIRVYEVARELGLQNRELIQRMAGLGIQVRNHMSVLDAAEVDRVKRALEKDKAETMVEERIRPTVVRRRSKVQREPEPAETVVTAPPVAPVAVEPEPIEARVEAAPPRPAPAKPPPPVSVKPAAEPAPAEAPSAVEPELELPVAPTPPAVEAPAAPSEAPRVAEVAEVAPVPAAPSVEAPVQAAVAEAEEGAAVGEDRFTPAYLPPGVTRRGNTYAPGAQPLSDATKRRILSQHAKEQRAPKRRREVKGSAIGPTGRHPGRPGKKKLAPGKKGKQTEITVPSAQKRLIRIEDQIQLQALAQRMSLKATDVLMKLMQMGVSGVHINSTLDADTAALLADEFGYEVENVARSETDLVQDARGAFDDSDVDRTVRPPIITVMGHVDHGKTSLLDRIRKSDVAAGEAGGITQHIGAYRVDTSGGAVVFLDTPGHEAFTAMRARGAQATDIVILVCAADDGVMPQTREAVNHAQAANVPIVVAINKIDRAEAQPERVINELAALGLQPEEWGGETIYVPCSAITGEGVDTLLESVLLQAEILDLTANPKVPAEGIVLEAYLDRGRGPVANVLVRDGTLRTGDFVVAGEVWGRVRAMTDDRGRQLKEAPPATPVEVLGLNELPGAGDLVYQVVDQRRAQEVADARRKPASGTPVSAAARGLEEIQAMLQSGEVHELKLVIKADVQGSVEALVKSFGDLSTEKVKVVTVHAGVGGITENDVMLARASNAIVIAFNVRPQGQASKTAKNENVEIRTYSIIYEAIDDVKAAMAGLLAPKLVEKELGKAEVRQVFSIPKIGAVAGSYVTEGKILRSGKARLIRDGVVVWEGQLASLRRFKEDAREVMSGYECGIGLQGYNDIKERDMIEVYEVEEVAATLDE